MLEKITGKIVLQDGNRVSWATFELTSEEFNLPDEMLNRVLFPALSKAMAALKEMPIPE